MFEVTDEGVFRRRRLLEGVLDGMCLAVPIDRRPSATFQSDASALDLDDEHPVCWIHQYEVGLTVTRSSVPHRLPGNAVENSPVVSQIAECSSHLELSVACAADRFAREEDGQGGVMSCWGLRSIALGIPQAPGRLLVPRQQGRHSRSVLQSQLWNHTIDTRVKTLEEGRPPYA